MKKTMLFILAVIMCFGILGSAVAQVPRLSGPVIKVLVASGVSDGDTLWATATLNPNTADADVGRWMAPKDIYFVDTEGALKKMVDRRVIGISLFAKEPFFAKAFWAGGDSSGLTMVKADTVNSGSKYLADGVNLVYSESYPVRLEFTGIIDTLRLNGTAADTIIVVPRWN